MPLASQIGAQAAVRRAIYSALIANTPLHTLLGVTPEDAATRIVDTPPDGWQTTEDDNSIFPFVFFTATRGSENNTDTSNGWVTEYDLLVISRYKGLAETEDILEAIEQIIMAFDTEALVDNFQIISLVATDFEIDRIQTADEKGLTTQALLTIRAIYEARS